MKFHLTAIFTNIVLILGIMYLYAFIVMSMDDMYFVKKGHDFAVCFSYLIFVFSWLSTFIIYKIKKQSTHFYYFLGCNLLGVLIITIFRYILFINTNSIPFEASSLFINLKYAILETIIPVTIISKCVSISQNLIGKKLLPIRYSKQA